MSDRYAKPCPDCGERCDCWIDPFTDMRKADAAGWERLVRRAREQTSQDYLARLDAARADVPAGPVEPTDWPGRRPWNGRKPRYWRAGRRA